jgi:hypothetical protein
MPVNEDEHVALLAEIGRALGWTDAYLEHLPEGKPQAISLGTGAFLFDGESLQVLGGKFDPIEAAVQAAERHVLRRAPILSAAMNTGVLPRGSAVFRWKWQGGAGAKPTSLPLPEGRWPKGFTRVWRLLTRWAPAPMHIDDD